MTHFLRTTNLVSGCFKYVDGKIYYNRQSTNVPCGRLNGAKKEICIQYTMTDDPYEVNIGPNDMSVSAEECEAYANSHPQYYWYNISTNPSSWGERPQGCVIHPSTNRIFYNTRNTKMLCSNSYWTCVQKPVTSDMGRIGICDTTRGACQCLPPFTDINFYTETDWRGKVIEKNEREYKDGGVTGRDLYRIRHMQGKESFIRNALQVLNVTNSRIVFTTSGTDHFVYNGQNDPDISLCQFYPYTIYHDHNEDMRIVRAKTVTIKVVRMGNGSPYLQILSVILFHKTLHIHSSRAVHIIICLL